MPVKRMDKIETNSLWLSRSDRRRLRWLSEVKTYYGQAQCQNTVALCLLKFEMKKYKLLQEDRHLLLAAKGGKLVHGNTSKFTFPHGPIFNVHHKLILQPQTYAQCSSASKFNCRVYQTQYGNCEFLIISSGLTFKG
jgi:hypothetical protein